MTEFMGLPTNAQSLSKRKLVHGVGINDSTYMTGSKDKEGNRSECPFYRTWKNMLERSYSPKYHETHPTYVGCSVCKDWLSFMNFRGWMLKQFWKNKHLDKDILIPGNKIYSPDTCCFVTRKVNNLLTDRGAARGQYKRGVHLHQGKFRAQCNDVNSKSVHLGYFDTEDEAYEAYVEFKVKLIRRIAYQQSTNIKIGLLRHGKLLKSSLKMEQTTENEVLIMAINKYGREALAINLQCSLSLINSVCISGRRFGLTGTPSMTDRVCAILDLPYHAVRPDMFDIEE